MAKGKILVFIYLFIFSKNSAPIGGGGKQCECIRICTCIHSYVDVCVCGMFSIDAKSHNKHGMFPLVRGSWKKRGDGGFLERAWKFVCHELPPRLSVSPPPLFFLSIMHFSFFFSHCVWGFFVVVVIGWFTLVLF